MKKIKTSILAFSLLALTGIITTSFIPADLDVVEEKKEKVNWLDIEAAYDSVMADTTGKKVFIDVYTDWCGWCKRMDNTTFKDKKVIEYLNENFYSVKFDGEFKGDVILGTDTTRFVNNGRRGYHELAFSLLGGRLSYPTVVIMDENFNVVSPVPGYRDGKDMLPVLEFLGEDIYKTKKWEEFKKEYDAREE